MFWHSVALRSCTASSSPSAINNCEAPSRTFFISSPKCLVIWTTRWRMSSSREARSVYDALNCQGRQHGDHDEQEHPAGQADLGPAPKQRALLASRLYWLCPGNHVWALHVLLVTRSSHLLDVSESPAQSGD